jgi:hypothetical protein
MLLIRASQMEAMAASRQEEFVLDAMASLRERHEAARAAPDDELRRRVVLGQGAAERYGLEGERHVLAFLDYRMVYGDGFPDGEDDSWARAILEDATVDDDDKLHALDTEHAYLQLASEDA